MKGLKHGELWQECERSGCENEPSCVYCFYCAQHCTCGREGPAPDPHHVAVLISTKGPEKMAEEEAQRQSYREWILLTTAGRHYTTERPPASLEWRHLRGYEGPGSWYTTGDRWEEADWGGETQYRNCYGNVVAYYLTDLLYQATLDSYWEELLFRYGGPAQAAQKVLGLAWMQANCKKQSGLGVIGYDAAEALVASEGEAFYLAMARSEPWYLTEGAGSRSRREEDGTITWERVPSEVEQELVRRAIPFTVLEPTVHFLRFQNQALWDAVQSQVGDEPSALYPGPDGRVFCRVTFHAPKYPGTYGTAIREVTQVTDALRAWLEARRP